jgi:2-polyprenyl-3-methyl-5-hydroxy-6-metoxy-1,4-benzoquinol methylase
VARALGSSARYVQKSIYDLDERFGQFDVVFCGSLLLHVSDPFEAMRRIRSVCRGQAIVATSILAEPACQSLPHCEFVGMRASDGDYWVYWTPNMATLEKMALAAGFTKVERVSTFELAAESQYASHRTLHGVVRAGI